MFTKEQFSYLAKRYMDTVFRLAFNYTKSQSEADDVTQEVQFLSPWKRIEPIEDYASTLSFTSPEHSELFYAVMDLPKKYRVPIFLHYYEDYSCEEISSFLGIANATVRTRLRRGREMPKTEIQEGENNV